MVEKEIDKNQIIAYWPQHNEQEVIYIHKNYKKDEAAALEKSVLKKREEAIYE